MKVKLVAYTPDPIATMAKAASVCYDSTPSAKIVEHCFKSGHWSIAEFADFHFEISGVSRATTHQLVRKRIASYAQRSQRFCIEDGLDFVIPPDIMIDTVKHRKYMEAINTAKRIYDDLLGMKVKPEDARMILPQAIHSVIHMKLNFRSLVDFCNHRLCTRSQWEIRNLASAMQREVSILSPFLGSYLVPKCEALGYCPEIKGCGRFPHKSEVIR